jgi:hypothetical protein
MTCLKVWIAIDRSIHNVEMKKPLRQPFGLPTSQTAQGQRRFRAPLATPVVASSSRRPKQCTVLFWEVSARPSVGRRKYGAKKSPVSTYGTATLFVKEG